MEQWMNGEGLAVGDVVFVIHETDTNAGTDRLYASDVPGHTNMSHEPRLTGWLGETNNRNRTALGLFRVSKIAKNGRAKVSPITDRTDLLAQLEELGYPELMPTD